MNVGSEVSRILEKHRPECESHLADRLVVAQPLGLEPQAAHLVREEVRAARAEVVLVLDGEVTTFTRGAAVASS